MLNAWTETDRLNSVPRTILPLCSDPARQDSGATAELRAAVVLRLAHRRGCVGRVPKVAGVLADTPILGDRGRLGRVQEPTPEPHALQPSQGVHALPRQLRSPGRSQQGFSLRAGNGAAGHGHHAGGRARRDGADEEG